MCICFSRQQSYQLHIYLWGCLDKPNAVMTAAAVVLDLLDLNLYPAAAVLTCICQLKQRNARQSTCASCKAAAAAAGSDESSS